MSNHLTSLTQLFKKVYNIFMPLTKNDLKAIKEIVDTSIDNNNIQIKDLVDFSVEKSERRLETRIEKIDLKID